MEKDLIEIVEKERKREEDEDEGVVLLEYDI